MASPRVATFPPPSIDVTKATLAFGPREIPKLNEQLHGRDCLIKQQALRSLADLARNELRAGEMLSTGVPESLALLLKDEDDSTRRLAVTVFFHLSVHVTMRLHFLATGVPGDMAALFQDSVVEVRSNAYRTVLNLCSTAHSAVAVVEAGLVPKVVSHLAKEVEQIQLTILDILHECVPPNPQLALACGTLAIVMPLLETENVELRAKAARTVMELCNAHEGKEEACKIGLIPCLITLLRDAGSTVRGMAAGSLMMIAVLTMGKHDIMEANGVEPLLALVHHHEDSMTILNAVKALTCLSEAANCRAQLRGHVPKFSALGNHPSQAVVTATARAVSVITWVA